MFEDIIWIIFAFGFLGILLPLVLSIVSLVKISNLKKEVKKLKNRNLIGEKKETVEDVFGVKNEKIQNPHGQNYIVEENNPINIEEKTNEEKHNNEFKFGSKWLTIIGVVSVIFGIGFFLKYAFDNNLITESGRVILGFISGVIFVIIGDYFKDKLKDYSQYLMGGGFAIVMLSAYFGLEYNLYSNGIAFLLMIITTFMAGLLSHKLNSKILAGTAVLAGFLAPVLASSGVANEIVLFNYILILVSGMFWLVYKHGWNFLIWGSLVGTMILYGGSMAEYYTNSVFWIYWIYLIIFFGFFAIAPFYSYLADKEDGLKGSIFNLIISALVGGIFIWLSYMMFEIMIKGEYSWEDRKYHGAVEMFKNLYWVIGLIPAFVYLWLSKQALKVRSKNGKNIILYLIIGMTTFSIAMIPALQFTGKWITLAWLIEAMILGYIFYKNNIKTFLYLGLATLVAGLFRLFAIDSYFRTGHYMNSLNQWVTDYTPIFNERTFIYLIGVLSIFTFAYFAFQRNEKSLAKWLGIIANLFILLWIYLELDSADSANYISSDVASLLLSIFYLIYAGLLIWIGVLKKYVGFRLFGLSLIGFIILKTYFVDIWDFDAIIRVLAFIILGGFILVISFYYSKISVNIKEFLQSKDQN